MRNIALASLLGGGLLFLASFKTNDKYFEILKNLDIFGTLYHEVNQNYVDEINPTELISRGIESMLSTLDPYTNYIPEDQIENFRTMTTGEYGGIGVILQQRAGKFQVIMPNKGYSAEKAGMRVGDEIVVIDGKEVSGRSLAESNDLLRGQAGSTVNLKVRRFGVPQLLDFTLKRERIHIPNVPFYGMVADNVGLVQLTDFTRKAHDEVKDAVRKLKEEGATRIILDLRGNPGGLLNEAIDISNLFVSRNMEIVRTKGKLKEWNRTYMSQNEPFDRDIPVAVLLNGNSASASEIVAGVLQDYDRGVLVGQRSFGKGLVQQTRPLSYNSKLKVTVAKYYIPSGRCIQEVDYSHRNQNGEAVKFADSLKTAFTTANGRPVFDGGGVTPDIITPIQKYSNVTESIVNQGLLFDYANIYHFNNEEIAPPTEFVLTEQEYTDFLNWVDEQKFTYLTNADRELIDLKESLEQNDYLDDLKESVDRLEQRLAKAKRGDLLKYKEEISQLLKYEIIKHYYYEEGVNEVMFKEDPDVLEAVQALNDQSRYKQILKG